MGRQAVFQTLFLSSGYREGVNTSEPTWWTSLAPALRLYPSVRGTAEALHPLNALWDQKNHRLIQMKRDMKHPDK